MKIYVESPEFVGIFDYKTNKYILGMIQLKHIVIKFKLGDFLIYNNKWGNTITIY